MRILATGGGTGGHVYPALSILEALGPDHEVSWVGMAGGIEERIIGQRDMAFHAVKAGPLRGANPLQTLKSVLQLAVGTTQAWRFVQQWRPDVVLATGGYVSVPLMLAARLARCPSLIYLPDMEPGLAVKFLARYAQRVAVSVPSAQEYFAADQVFVSGYPVRKALFLVDRSDAHATLGLESSTPVLLIIGGSRGARSINEDILAKLEKILAMAQVVHICGKLDYQRLAAHRDQLTGVAQKRYHLYAYLDQEMPSALAAADLVVARSGASVIGEMPAIGAPSILVPYPHAGQHQMANARFLADSGASVILEDATLADTLWPTIDQLLADKERMATMRQAAGNLARPHAARDIARELLTLAGEGGNG